MTAEALVAWMLVAALAEKLAYAEAAALGWKLVADLGDQARRDMRKDGDMICEQWKRLCDLNQEMIERLKAESKEREHPEFWPE